MARRLIDFTDNAALRPTLPPGLSFYYVRNLVAKHVGKDAAAMLSEPQAVPGEGRRQWLIEAPVSARAERLGRLPPEDAETVRRALAAVRQRVHQAYNTLWTKGDESSRQQANAIFRAFEIPDDEENIWLIGDQTVLVGWGHVKAHARVLKPAELVVDLRPVENLTSPKISTQREPYQRGQDEPPLPPQAPPSGPASKATSVLAALLWLAFVALVGAAGWRLLEACSIQVMGETIYASSSGVCKIPQNPFADLLAQNDALVGALRSEQVSLLSRPYCSVARPQPQTPPAQGLTDGEERARQQGADFEGLVGVTLEWQSYDDLDLLIDCPGGKKISPRREDRNELGGCGDGDRDVDANDSRKPEWTRTDMPTEHIKWHKMPRGHYRVKIYPNSVQDSAPIPYKVALRLKGKPVIQCEGTVWWDGVEGKGAAQYAIDFDPYSKRLPQCRYEDSPLHSCKECGK
jgi:hypothetical protein